MNINVLKTVFLLVCLIGVFGCQTQDNMVSNINSTASAPASNKTEAIENLNKVVIKNKPFIYPCKNMSSPPIKNKSKIKAMLIKEGKIDTSMSDEEINNEVNRYIKKKMSARCKPSIKKVDITPLQEEKTHV